MQGTNVVASMVVFEDGLARKSEYRRFAIRDTAGGDVDWIAEVVRRRFARYLDEAVEAGPARGAGRRADDRAAASTRSPAGRASSPTRRTCSSSTAARRRSPRRRRVLDDLGIDDVALVGLAKRLEEVWLPGRAVPG